MLPRNHDRIKVQAKALSDRIIQQSASGMMDNQTINLAMQMQRDLGSYFKEVEDAHRASEELAPQEPSGEVPDMGSGEGVSGTPDTDREPL